MKPFKVFCINNNQKYVLVTSTTDLYYLYDEIIKEINIKEASFSILVDMIFINGFTFNRFLQLVFENGKYSHTNIVNPRNVSEELKSNTKNYFKQNKNILNYSTISKISKDFILA